MSSTASVFEISFREKIRFPLFFQVFTYSVAVFSAKFNLSNTASLEAESPNNKALRKPASA